jgi:hypothetical protein
MGEACIAQMGNKKKYVQYVFIKLEEMRPHAGLWCTLESNIEINLLDVRLSI